MKPFGKQTAQVKRALENCGFTDPFSYHFRVNIYKLTAIWPTWLTFSLFTKAFNMCLHYSQNCGTAQHAPQMLQLGQKASNMHPFESTAKTVCGWVMGYKSYTG